MQILVAPVDEAPEVLQTRGVGSTMPVSSTISRNAAVDRRLARFALPFRTSQCEVSVAWQSSTSPVRVQR